MSFESFRKKVRRCAAGLFLRPAVWLLGGEKVFSNYFLGRAVLAGISYPDALCALRKIRRLVQWSAPWYRLGLRDEKLAGRALAGDVPAGAASLWLSAGGSYFMAQSPFFIHPSQREKIRKRMIRAYSAAAPLMKPAAEPVEISMGDSQLTGVLRIPGGSSPHNRCVVIFGGPDRPKETMHGFGEFFVRRDYSVCLLDVPGISRPDRGRADAFFDGLRGAFPGIQFEAFCFVGLGLGSLAAVNLASSGAARSSCIVISPVCPSVRTLEAVSCPILVIAGAKDSIFAPHPEAYRGGWFYGAKDVLVYPDAGYECAQRHTEMLLAMEKWLSGVFEGRI